MSKISHIKYLQQRSIKIRLSIKKKLEDNNCTLPFHFDYLYNLCYKYF